MNSRWQWAVIILAGLLVVGYAAYVSRTPGPCSSPVHPDVCNHGVNHGGAWYTMGH